MKLGADDYGMKSYTLAILKAGTNKSADEEFVNACFRGHMENILKMEEEGKPVVAGPTGKNDTGYRGIFILTVTDTVEVEQLLANDPAIREKLLEAELYSWYGSAALPEYLDEADKVWKAGFELKKASVFRQMPPVLILLWGLIRNNRCVTGAPCNRGTAG